MRTLEKRTYGHYSKPHYIKYLESKRTESVTKFLSTEYRYHSKIDNTHPFCEYQVRDIGTQTNENSTTHTDPNWAIFNKKKITYKLHWPSHLHSNKNKDSDSKEPALKKRKFTPVPVKYPVSSRLGRPCVYSFLSLLKNIIVFLCFY